MIRDNRSTKRSVIIPKGEGVVWVSHIRETREMLKVKIPLRLRNPERRMIRVYLYQVAKSHEYKCPKFLMNLVQNSDTRETMISNILTKS